MNEDDIPISIRAKWVMDGAKTLPEAAQKLREYALWLERVHQHGYTLDHEVQDDYGFVNLPADGSDPMGLKPVKVL